MMEIETDADVAERIERSFYVNWPLSVFETATHFYYESVLNSVVLLNILILIVSTQLYLNGITFNKPAAITKPGNLR